jgi:hypothetical protein
MGHRSPWSRKRYQRGPTVVPALEVYRGFAGRKHRWPRMNRRGCPHRPRRTYLRRSASLLSCPDTRLRHINVIRNIEFASILIYRSGSMFDGSQNATSHDRADSFVACPCLAEGELRRGCS